MNLCRIFNAGRFFSRGCGKHPRRVIESCELIYVVSGKLELFEEQRVFSVGAGERLLLFPGRIHGGVSPYERDLSFFWLHFMPEDKTTAEELEELPQHAPVGDRELFATCMQLILTEQRKPAASHAIRQHLLAVLLEDSARLPPCQNSENHVKVLAEKAFNYIALHFSESISTSAIAREFDCHPDYLSRLYSQTYRCTIGQAIRAARINKACQLLENTVLPVKEIADLVGYGDVSYFRKQFEAQCALSPHKYRKLRNFGHVNTE